MPTLMMVIKMKKRIIIALTFFVGIIVTLVLLSKPKDPIQIRKTSEKDILNYVKTHQQNDYPILVTSPLNPNKQQDDVDEGDLFYYDDLFLYVIDYQKLSIVDIQNKTIFKELVFENFTPTELLLTQEQIILLGIKQTSLSIEITFGKNFPYTNTECVIYILNKNDYSIERYLSFDESYYVCSYKNEKGLYFIVSNNDFIDKKNKKIIYPSYFDSKYGIQQLNKEELYLSNSGNPIYSLKMLCYLNLMETKPLKRYGFLGVEGITKMNHDFFMMTSTLYYQDDVTVVHIFSLNTLKYQGYVSVKGYLINSYAFDTYQNYLRIATSYFEHNQPINQIYNIDLIHLTIISKKNIAPSETIYALRFHENHAYLSTYLYIDPLFVLDFSNPHEIQIKAQKEIDYLCEYLSLKNDSIFSIGRVLDDKNLSTGIRLSLFNPATLQSVDEYTINQLYADIEVRFQQKGLIQSDSLVIFSMSSQQASSVEVFNVQQTIQPICSILYNDDYIIRISVVHHELICLSYDNLYFYDLSSYQLLKILPYHSIETKV